MYKTVIFVSGQVKKIGRKQKNTTGDWRKSWQKITSGMIILSIHWKLVIIVWM